MKSSRRAPRYRRRFLTHTRTSLRQLQALVQAGQLGQIPFSSWETLFRGLCLKSAQEHDASPDAKIAASLAGRRVIRLTPGYRDPLLRDYSQG